MTVLPVHVVSGFLGAGKTTLLMHELARRAKDERCAIVVNDFGEAQLDAALMEQHAPVRSIPGGCICCTAPEGLVPALRDLIEKEQPDRIFIETTGLARPADVVDTLVRSGIASLDLQATVVVVDPDRFVADNSELFLQQLAAADVVVASRADSASPSAVASLREWAEKRYPPLEALHVVEKGRLADGVLDRPRPKGFRVVSPALHPSTKGWSAQSRTWSAERVFEMGRLKIIAQKDSIERLKGIFRTDIGWYCIQVAGGKFEAVPTGIRGGSRVDGISQNASLLETLIAEIDAAVAPEVDPHTLGSLRLEGVGNGERVLSRADLLALPGQVVDVAALVPGRQGEGVWLADVLALSGCEPSVSFVVVAGDGMTSAPAAIGESGEAILVHSLNGEPYPRDKGGPYRIFVPPGEGRSACSNVKQVVRVSIGD